MDREQRLLGQLGEECGEVSKECSKANNFGLDSFYPHDPNRTTNRQLIVDELNDLMAVVEMLVEEGHIPENWESEEKKKLKKDKVNMFIQVSKDLGRVK